MNAPFYKAHFPMSVSAQMQHVGTLPDGKRIYWAEPGQFENPGLYYSDDKAINVPFSPPAPPAHPDHVAVDRFARQMKDALDDARLNRGRAGWDNPDVCTLDYLSDLLHEKVAAGDAVAIANYAMMIWSRGGKVAPVANISKAVEKLTELCSKHRFNMTSMVPANVHAALVEIIELLDPQAIPHVTLESA